MPLIIVCQDITKMNVDAIVNAANTDLQMGGGVCGTIFRETKIMPQAPLETIRKDMKKRGGYR